MVRAYPREYNGFIPPPKEIAKLDFLTDSECVANLVNVNMWLTGYKRATEQSITWICYTRITTFLLLIS